MKSLNLALFVSVLALLLETGHCYNTQPYSPGGSDKKVPKPVVPKKNLPKNQVTTPRKFAKKPIKVNVQKISLPKIAVPKISLEPGFDPTRKKQVSPIKVPKSTTKKISLSQLQCSKKVRMMIRLLA